MTTHCRGRGVGWGVALALNTVKKSVFRNLIITYISTVIYEDYSVSLEMEFFAFKFFIEMLPHLAFILDIMLKTIIKPCLYM